MRWMWWLQSCPGGKGGGGNGKMDEVHCTSIPCPIKYSPWWKLFYSGDECALITVTGFDYRMFYILHDRFQIMYGCFTMFEKNNYSVQKVTNKRG
eukprot:2012376-Ditylum_brightwellii.AAC.1